jgi:hypothetical protein
MNAIYNWTLMQVYLFFNSSFLCDNAGKLSQNVRVWCIVNMRRTK